MIPSHYHYSYSHKMPYSKIEAMGNMTTGRQMHKITRATQSHIFPNLTSQDQRFVREKNSRLAAFCKDRHFPHPRFAIATNLRMHALDFVQFFLISAHTHTNTSPGKHQNRLHRKIRAKSASLMKDPFSFTGLFP